jgi:hypothetical protein
MKLPGSTTGSGERLTESKCNGSPAAPQFDHENPTIFDS